MSLFLTDMRKVFTKDGVVSRSIELEVYLPVNLQKADRVVARDLARSPNCGVQVQRY